MTPLSESTDANLVLTLEEITNLAEQEGKPADTLMNVVALIATRFRTDVCSAYLLEPDRSNLVLAATLGLHPRAIGTLRMPLHEGLSGLVAEQLVPVAVPDAREHPRYKYFKESGEEEYHSFLGVPLIDRGVLQGVLVVQTKDPRVFRDNEIRMLAEAAAPGCAGGERGADPRPVYCPGAGEAVGTGAQRVVELGQRVREPVSRFESHALSPAESESYCAAERNPAGARSSGGPRSWCCIAASTTHTGASRSTCTTTAPGARAMRACCGRGRWPIFPRSSDCMSRCRFTPAAWACWPATTSRAPRTWTFR